MKLVPVLIVLSFTNMACAYSFGDLPAGWPWDQSKIQGTLLPAVTGLAADDPNAWLVPIGEWDRFGTTNQYVTAIEVINVPSSVGVFLQTDPDKKTSVTWTVEGWSIPGCWYLVVDAVGAAGKSGNIKRQRYTIVGAGYAPDDVVPILD